MDNTLLKSNIDFHEMKQVVYDFLLANEIIEVNPNWESQTASQIIESGRAHPRFAQFEQKVWRLVGEVEAKGMRDAALEPHAREILQALKEANKIVTIATNNAYSAAREALEQLSIFHMFDCVIGREQMEALKPSPSCLFIMMRKWGQLPKDQWVFIGDSWIDGMAAQEAGIPFISYQANQDELLEQGVATFEHTTALKELERLLL
ncbi:hypothetical protein BEP19_16455 [Ammoniphilus oxalaticus]|uniref:Haloacid dehalogenase n=2 Tax=Ammoniphilus oxalaticus TaxID=66863 RepID=A0A419SR18_9BACL|nr:hypothetical protein BEP19_16455 [Ammoniphilus oxalaticus]